MVFMDLEDVLSKLREVFERFGAVRLAVLFGSYAKGEATPSSDVDIAVLAEDRGVILDLAAEVSRTLGIPETLVSIIDLRLANPVLAVKILREGVKIIDRGVNIYEVIPSSSEIVEVYELESAATSVWLKKDPIDMGLLREIEARIDEDVRDLKELLEMGRDRVLANKHLKKSFERTLQTLIEGMVDMLRHVVSGLNLGVATYFRDYVNIARNRGVISEETSNNLRRLIPLRHTLVYKYRGLRYDELWREADTSVKTAGKLVREVKKYLKTKRREQ